MSDEQLSQALAHGAAYQTLVQQVAARIDLFQARFGLAWMH
jgi:hypothetical protein